MFVSSFSLVFLWLLCMFLLAWLLLCAFKFFFFSYFFAFCLFLEQMCIIFILSTVFISMWVGLGLIFCWSENNFSYFGAVLNTEHEYRSLAEIYMVVNKKGSRSFLAFSRAAEDIRNLFDFPKKFLFFLMSLLQVSFLPPFLLNTFI